MIVSCSRRTDIPAAYTRWLLNRLAAGYCTVVNPMNIKQVSRISLCPDDVDVIVFWSKNPAPLIPHLHELDERGYRYYFQYTVNGYDPGIEPNVPDIDHSIEVFRNLSRMVGRDRVIWRYDPIILTRRTDVNYHLERFSCIARALAGFSERVIISIVDRYRKTERGFRELDREGYAVERDLSHSPVLGSLVSRLVDLARQAGLEIQSCAEEIDLIPYGVPPGKCIDDSLIERIFGIRVISTKDSTQRPACLCVKSRDIGMYDTCPAGCRYCYATTNHVKASQNASTHDEKSPSVLGWFEADVSEDSGRDEQLRLPLFHPPIR